MMLHFPFITSTSIAPFNARSSWRISWFKCTRIAWNGNFGGARRSSAMSLFASLMMSASRLVDEMMPPSSRCLARMHSAMRSDSKASSLSPHVWITQASSSADTVRSHSLAGIPCVGFIRMSSGPSLAELKPRAGSSNCGLDTPKSISTPLTCSGPKTSAISPKGRWITVNRGSCASSCRATLIASGSTSNAKTRASALQCPRISLVCPPRPKVQST
mmetsp:Transcript_114076/g.318628  ORF Transcript_114076/g.318628 Transcript_114076/m.318628 type:complete len:217 (-) Transcript_114076:134-784(-)